MQSLDDGSAAIHTVVLWKSPQWTRSEAIIEERSTIRVYPIAEEARRIDFEIDLLALHPETRLGGSDDVKGYGGFSPRLRLPADVQFVGEVGDIEPQRTSVAAGRWLNVVGSLSGESKSGVAILCHPSLPVFPPQWILRRAHSMQNVVFPGRKPVPLSRTEPLVLRYRLVVHDGAAAREAIARWQRDFERSGAEQQ